MKAPVAKKEEPMMGTIQCTPAPEVQPNQNIDIYGDSLDPKKNEGIKMTLTGIRKEPNIARGSRRSGTKPKDDYDVQMQFQSR